MKWIPGISTAALLALTACSGGGSGGGGSGVVNLSATDDPFVFDIVTEAEISVDRITIYPGDGDEGPIVIHEGSAIRLDLLSLHDGVTQELATAELPAGNYRQLRLHVTDARLVLINGNVYTTADGTIHLTSQDTSGFKVFIDPPIPVERGQTARALLDFDMTRTFHPVPANDPLNATQYSFHPVIHVTNLGQAGGIQGTVSRDDGAGGTTPVEAATVYLQPPGVTDPAQAIATTGTNAEGSYAFPAIAPGTYDVRAVHEDLEGAVTGVVVTIGEVTVVDILLHGTTGSIHGSVTQDDGSGGTVPAAGATVHVLPPGVTDPAQAVASATTAADGTYAADNLPPSTYDVMGVLGALQATSAGVVVSAGAVTTVDMTLQGTAGGIRGTVTQDDGSGGLVPAVGATVLVLPPGVIDPAQAVSTTTTAADGTYIASGIVPGTYDVLVLLGALQATAPSVGVVSGNFATVDLTVH